MPSLLSNIDGIVLPGGRVEGVLPGGVLFALCCYVIVKHAGTSYRDSLDRLLWKDWNGHHKLENTVQPGLITVITVTLQLLLLLLLLLYIQ